MKKNIVLLQARLDSNRLPGKVLLPINGIAMIDLQIARIHKAKKIEGLIVAVPDTAENDKLHEHLSNNAINTFRGPLDNVLKRFVLASEKFPSHAIIRLTGDCPFVMPSLIDEMIEVFEARDIDYLSNTIQETFPDGLDIEIFKTSALKRLSIMSLTEQEKEHVTLGIYSRPSIFSISNFESSVNLGELRWTVDYSDDFEFVSKVFNYFKGRESDFGIEDILEFMNRNPHIQNKRSAKYRNISLKSSQ